MRKVHLYGALAAEFGPVYELEVNSLAEAARALGANFEGFRQRIVDGHFRVVAGPSLEEGIELGEDQIDFGVGNRDIHIVPVVAGAKKNAGLGKIIAGVLIAAFAWFALPAMGIASIGIGAISISAGNLAMMGVSIALAGVSQMLTPKQKKPVEVTPVEQKPSFIFNGAVNVTEQGGPVPLIYGRTMVGSTVISAGMSVENISDPSLSDGKAYYSGRY